MLQRIMVTLRRQIVVVAITSTLLAIANASSLSKKASIYAHSIFEQAAVGTRHFVLGPLHLF
jgi:hypothetical protein